MRQYLIAYMTLCSLKISQSLNFKNNKNCRAPLTECNELSKDDDDSECIKEIGDNFIMEERFTQ